MKKSSFFWVSFSDLMISLFFIMLVLFAVSTPLLFSSIKTNEGLIKENDNLKNELSTLSKDVIKVDILRDSLNSIIVENKRLNRLLRIEEQFELLHKNKNFIYLKDCKKFVASKLIGKEIFDSLKTDIRKDYVERTIEAGKQLEGFISELQKRSPDLSYLLVIEGNMANTYDKIIEMDDEKGYKKSYMRALSVYQLWRKNNIDFRIYNTEVMICGSGFSGLCRDEKEENNKRFSIQIIPKVESKSNKS